MAGGAGGAWLVNYEGIGGGSSGGGGAAAGPAILVNLGSVILDNVSGAGFSAIAGQPGASSGNSYEFPAYAGTASSVAVFNYGGTVNGSSTVGPISSALPGGAAVPGTPTSQNFGSEPVNSSITQPIFFTIASGTTVGSIAILTQGAPNLDFIDGGSSTCTAQTYASQTDCTVNVKFTPAVAGLRKGAVVFYSGANRTGTALATAYVYGIGTGPQVAFPSNAAVNTVGSGFVQPSGVAVDGGGNVFVADYGSGAVKEILAAGGYTTVSTLGSGFSFPNGVAVDGGGNVYVADRGNNAVKEILAAGGYTTVIPLGSGFNLPDGVAVDGSGNVFVADTDNSKVKEILAAGGYTTVIPLGSGFSFPTGVAVDGGGNVFVADYSHNAVKEILAAGGYTTVNTVGSGFSSPIGVAVDGGGNVYVADTKNNQIKELPLATPPTLTFPTATAGSTSTDSPQTVTVENIGNADLNIDNVAYATDFPEASGVATDCASSPALSAGTSCTLSIDFSPLLASATGLSTPLGESVSLTDNNLNVANAVQSASVSGTETAPPVAQLAFGTPPAANIAAG
ncbi:MAG TPA: hypothetical protein VG267_06565, partial [Terracidiphilus sp.]|nr:hypothetical protein [Terracidiphilus sp.]